MSAPRSEGVYVDEPWLSVRWDRNRKCVHAEWKGFCNSVQFRDGTLAILEAIRGRHAVSLVSDNRRLEGVANEDQLWLRDTWVPLAVSQGLKRIAVVLARYGLGKIASEEIISRFGSTDFVTRTFDSLDDALSWVSGDEKPVKADKR